MNRRFEIIGLGLSAFAICATAIVWLEGWAALARLAKVILPGVALVVFFGWRLGGQQLTESSSPAKNKPAEQSEPDMDAPLGSSVPAECGPNLINNQSVSADVENRPPISSATDPRAAFFAQELHDEVAEHVSAIKSMGVAIARRAQNPAMMQASQLVVESADQLEAAIENVLRRHRSENGPHQGLSDSIAAMVEQYKKIGVADRAVRKITLRISPEVDAADPAVANAAYRITRQALDNAVAHAGASQIEVNLRVLDHNLLAQVTDNGIGMPQKLVGQHGLEGMGDRARAVGGVFEVGKGRLGGVIARAKLPLTLPARAANG